MKSGKTRIILEGHPVQKIGREIKIINQIRTSPADIELYFEFDKTYTGHSDIFECHPSKKEAIFMTHVHPLLPGNS